ncbi:ribonuclease domain-containing protein [Psychrobacter sp. APC 3281]|uniref:ribonuclease domain-containing protein n=1 Tax=Psychrobacter sp. APC 3281 TaxID=3035190 RepID=UPI0025B5FE6F|nr:ribonuclease domain-containing protein [Psychrobacter sp. APC 3281]MDN3447266.1 ribonuclease domain-containing protein [Psychrobacter sp. APC 3281]
MQSGKIKHWNEDKGYGFIDVDNQNEDVFFHISKARLAKPITVGQSVYFNSARNDKNQLRATEVTSSSLSLEQDTASDVPSYTPANTNSHHSTRNSNRSRPNKRSLGSTLFSLIAIIAIAFYFFGDLNSTLLADSIESTTVSQDVTNNTSQAAVSGITGDAQVDNTIALIQQGGPFPYPNKDGTTFYNREGRLPAQSQGYYHEYTVPTPGVSHRGARRIVTGGNPPTVYYLTVDHYDSFQRLQVP